MPSSLRNIMKKLPYKLREKLRNVEYDLQEQKDSRVAFIYLMTFVEKQVKFASDPFF